ncbi:MAG: GlsB/YeaQ/YmgE family stress response membrane protein [Lachnospiraceae bacterium]|nr:GlsB/YeaQ/YmgE family stress response membrane protein [Lachnospiraceae bacterium]
MIGLIWKILVGGLAGTIAEKIMKSNNGLLFNIILGIIGSVVGGLLFGLVGFASTNIIGEIIASTVGACVVIFVARVIKKNK